MLAMGIDISAKSRYQAGVGFSIKNILKMVTFLILSSVDSPSTNRGKICSLRPYSYNA